MRTVTDTAYVALLLRSEGQGALKKGQTWKCHSSYKRNSRKNCKHRKGYLLNNKMRWKDELLNISCSETRINGTLGKQKKKRENIEINKIFTRYRRDQRPFYFRASLIGLSVFWFLCRFYQIYRDRCQNSYSAGELKRRLKEKAKVSVIFSSLYGNRTGHGGDRSWQEVWAVHSWSMFGRKIQPDNPPLILGLVDDAEFCDRSFSHIPEFLCVELQCTTKIPTIPCVFKRASTLSLDDSLAIFVNGDIVFPLGMADVFESARATFGKSFQVVGQRVDILPQEWMTSIQKMSFQNLEEFTKRQGVLHPNYGIDYFFIPSNILREPFPPYYIGRWRWDNHMLYKMLLNGIPTVDASLVSPVIHFGEYKYNHQSREGNQENDILATRYTGKRFLLGKTSNAAFIAERTQNGVEVFSRKQEDEILMFILKSRHSIEHINLLIVTDHDAVLAMNWICWARLLENPDYVILTSDKKTFEFLKGLRVFLFDSSEGNSRSFTDYFMTLVLDLIEIASINVTLSGPSVLRVSHFDMALYDTCGIVTESRERGNQLRMVHLNAHHVLNSGVLGQREDLWKYVRRCLGSSNLCSGRIPSIPSVRTQCDLVHCVGEVLRHFPMRKCTFPEEILVHEDDFFDRGEPQKHGIVPKGIIFNEERNTRKAIDRLTKHDMMLWDEKRQQCTNVSQRLEVSEFKSSNLTRKIWSVKIRVLTSDRPVGLRRLLTSLQDAIKDFSKEAVLEISIDFPPTGHSIEYYECLMIARKFQWPHKLAILQPKENQGLLKQWVSASIELEHQMLVVLEDDMEVSPRFFEYLEKAIDHFYVNSDNYDPQNFGVMLHPQHALPDGTILPAILGRHAVEVGMSKHNSLDIDAIMPKGMYYRYQILSTWGPIFFPGPWASFREWVLSKLDDDNYEPCVPGLKSNPWTKRERPGKIWSTYFTRFVYERGLYGVHISYPADRNEQTKMLLYNHKDKGLNSIHFIIEPPVPSSQVLLLDTDSLSTITQFPRMSETPIYDFHFDQVSSVGELIARPLLAEVAIDKCFVLPIFYT